MTSTGTEGDRESPLVLTIAIGGPLLREDLPGLYRRTCALLRAAQPPELLLLEVRGIAADAVTIDALARLALAARRQGARAVLCGASSELCRLVELVGLGDVLMSAGA